MASMQRGWAHDGSALTAATLALNVAAFGGCSGDDGPRGNGGGEARAGTNAPAQALDRANARFPGVIGPGVVDRFEDDGMRVRARVVESAIRGVVHVARVDVARRAGEPTRIEDETSGLAVELAPLGGNPDVPATFARGLVHYGGAAPGGGDLIHRVGATGMEDFVSFDRQPPNAEMRYRVDVSAVAGLRLVRNVLELLDDDGTPRLRVRQPYIVDAQGQRHAAALSVERCAMDTDPRGPWGRPVKAPGATACELVVKWELAPDGYPALLDPMWETVGSLPSTPRYPKATTLNNGRVYVSTISAEYDPTTKTFAMTGGWIGGSVYEDGHSATLLQDGRVVVAGGTTGSLWSNGAAVYDPAAGMGTLVAATGLATPPTGRAFHDAALLWDGRVMFVSGHGSDGFGKTDTAFYTPGNPGSLSGGPTTLQRTGSTATTLTTNEVLVVGGRSAAGGTAVTNAEIYNGTSFSTISGAVARWDHTATPLSDGKVLVAGGEDASGAVSAAEVYDPMASGTTWSDRTTAVGPLNFARYNHTATLLTDGRVLVVGGQATTMKASLFDPATGGFTNLDDTMNPRRSHGAARLLTGQVLMAGGFQESSAELFGRVQGETCDDDIDCVQSGECVDGVCCDTACSATCMSCLGSATGGADGACAPVLDGQDPRSDCDDDGPLTCNDDGSCDGAGACRKYPSGTSCGSTMCSNGVLSNPECNGSGSCLPNNATCDPYVCADGSSCATMCTSDAGCTADHWCDTPTSTCLPDRAQGALCTKGAQCPGGHCVDGVCCNTACNGICQACAAALKESQSLDGTCGPAGSGTDPRDHCADAGGCGFDGFCDGAGACRNRVAGTACGMTQCTGNVVTGQICDGSGTCINDTTGTDCAPWVCKGNACASPCSDNTDCVAGNYCDTTSGDCKPLEPVGSPCVVNAECTSTFCADSVCCSAECTGDCNACKASLKESGTDDGTCGPAAAGTDPRGRCTADDPATCARNGFCDGSGACALYPSGSVCGAATCSNNAPTGFLCDGAGSCATMTAPPCDPYACATDSCRTTCALDGDCAANAYCEGGQCVAQFPDGDACTEGRECASGFCIDGYCCDRACDGQCEACDATGSEGACTGITGEPHGGRPACPGATGSDPCGARSCDPSQSVTSCAGFVGSTVECRSQSCAGGIETVGAFCDGTGECPAEKLIECAPYVCGADQCRTECDGDDDCTDGSVCDLPTKKCISGSACVDDFTVQEVGKGPESCEPYRCIAGSCLERCTDTTDCVSSHVCDSDTSQCVSAGKGSGSGDEGGCGCEVPGRRNRPAPVWALIAATAVALSRARRRR